MISDASLPKVVPLSALPSGAAGCLAALNPGRMGPSRRRFWAVRVTLALVCLWLGAGRVNAATYTYTNTTTGTTTQWAAGTNWDVVPVSASDTALVFGAGAGLVNTNVLTANNDVADPFVLNSLTMSYAGTGTGTNFAKVTISGGTLNFVSNGGIGPTLALNATGSTGAGLNTIPQISIDANVSLSDALTVTGNSSAIINGIVSGSVGITKNAGSSGILALAGANTYTGVTTISNGSISVRHNQGLGTTDGATVVTAGGALLMSGGVTVTGESLAIDGDGAATAGALRNESGNNTWAGDITVGGSATTRVVSTSGTLTISGNVAVSSDVTDQFVLQGDGNGVISGNISGAGRVTKSTTGTGRWILSGVNTYTGITTISGGILQFAKRVSLYNADTSKWTSANITAAAAGALALNVGGTDEFTLADVLLLQNMGFVAGSGLGLDTTNAAGGTFDLSTGLTNTNLRLIKLGTGILTLSVANAYTGVTTVSGGTVRVLNDQSMGTPTGGATVASGATLELVGGRTITETGATSAISGSGVGSVGALYSSSGNNVWNGNIDADTTQITRIGVEGVSSLTINGNIKTTGTAANGLVFQGVGSTTVNGVISGNGQLTRSSNGAGVLVLTGANTYTGNTIISNGTIQVGVAGVGSLGATNVAIGFSSSTVKGTLAGTGSVGGLVTVASGAIISPGDSAGAGTGSLTLAGGLTLNAGGGAVLNYNLGTTAASDKIVMTGGTFTSNTTGSTTFAITPGVGYDNGIYDLIDWTNLAVTATGVDLTDFAVTGLGAGKIGTFQFDITGRILQLNVTPEPGRAMLLMLGLVAVAGRRRRR
ncbi:beta strand repeat-containing protein [Verrucomicrobium spinosum]|uniref:beta strand repeat-containing protein n=1 Tax=Verrucomicrobium spinosum TaxID=2736 RepID=UPI000492DA80|nr:autotransporter-associated beta strand repeat-containing protein [Verrucomicrobium spinosum]